MILTYENDNEERLVVVEAKQFLAVLVTSMIISACVFLIYSFVLLMFRVFEKCL